MKLYAQFKNGRIIPEYNTDYDKLGKIRPDTTYLVNITKPRNIGRHRMFFAMVSMVFDNQDQYDNTDDLRSELTIKAGYFRVVKDLDGADRKRPKSISFANMDDLEFNAYYKSVWDVVARWLDISDDEIRDNLVSYM